MVAFARLIASDPASTIGGMDRLSSDFLRDFFAEDTLFSGLGPESLRRVVAIARQTIVKKDEHLFLMGQPCDALHFMALGAALLVMFFSI